jgi:hypothetical protein
MMTPFASAPTRDTGGVGIIQNYSGERDHNQTNFIESIV